MTINCLYLLFILTSLAGRIAQRSKSRLLSACVRRKLAATPPYALRKSACLLSTIHCCLVELYFKFNPVQSSEENENKLKFFYIFFFHLRNVRKIWILLRHILYPLLCIAFQCSCAYRNSNKSTSKLFSI